ncbi:hypothetical protein U0X36_05815 [Bacillus thuringiensis]|uniref:hypothetical protein n=1 Tax=Bacillus thuringiensis TaxID=1428 RepID=UPI000E4C82B9|nr:hypothetical protein [Bacillus thuringiensis]MDZ3952457.1 hypothetical protein [Bacillus thuringiensis]RGP53823.1 hypothetical protein BTW32_09710 [Bacillus thuringiensis]
MGSFELIKNGNFDNPLTQGWRIDGCQGEQKIAYISDSGWNSDVLQMSSLVRVSQLLEVTPNSK